MLAIIATIIILSILASILVITASMLSSRLSRVEDRFLVSPSEVEELSSTSSEIDPLPPTP